MPGNDRILIEREGAIATITFNRPERLNALDPEMVVEFTRILAELDGEAESKVIVITGAGRAFTAGGDVMSFGSAPDQRVNRRAWRLVYRMLEIEKPMIAMVNGPAIGIGLTIALLCDLVVATDDALLGDPHVNLGAVAGDGAVTVLPFLIGPHRAKQLLLTGRNITGETAATMGMINCAVPESKLKDVTLSLAEELADKPTYAVRATKLVVNRFVRWMVGQTLDVALAYEEISRSLPEYSDAVQRWKTGRLPDGDLSDA